MQGRYLYGGLVGLAVVAVAARGRLPDRWRRRTPLAVLLFATLMQAVYFGYTLDLFWTPADGDRLAALRAIANWYALPPACWRWWWPSCWPRWWRRWWPPPAARRGAVRLRRATAAHRRRRAPAAESDRVSVYRVRLYTALVAATQLPAHSAGVDVSRPTFDAHALTALGRGPLRRGDRVAEQHGDRGRPDPADPRRDRARHLVARLVDVGQQAAALVAHAAADHRRRRA